MPPRKNTNTGTMLVCSSFWLWTALGLRRSKWYAGVCIPMTRMHTIVLLTTNNSWIDAVTIIEVARERRGFLAQNRRDASSGLFRKDDVIINCILGPWDYSSGCNLIFHERFDFLWSRFSDEVFGAPWVRSLRKIKMTLYPKTSVNRGIS